MKAILRRSRISPKKANLVASLVRGKTVKEALPYLRFVPKKSSTALYELISSAVANAENNFGQKRANLFIKSLIVTKGPTSKRFIPISRGRVHPIRKMTSHIRVELGIIEKTAETEKKSKAKKIKTPAS